jgi:HEAT repeat protein
MSAKRNRVWGVLTALLLAAAVDGLLWPHSVLAQSDEAREKFETAQELLQRERFARAAQGFQEVFEGYSSDKLAGEAMYWYAFALYRLGNRDELTNARDALKRALADYADALDRGDAEDLLERVEGKLARRGDAEAGRRIVDRAQDDDADEDLRMAALNALIHIDSDRALPIIKKVVENPDRYSSEMRSQAIFLLAQHGGGEVEDLMIDLAKNDKDDEVREQAIFWLSQVDSERALDLLLELLQSNLDKELEEKIIFGIAQHGDERSAKVLRDIAGDRDRDPETREQAIFWLGQLDDDNFVFLRDLYADAERRDMKEKIIFSISQQGGSEQAAFLLEVLRDENEDTEIRKNALFWLGQTGRLDLDDLKGMYSTLDDREMREQAIFVISQQGGKKAADLLLQIVKEEKDPELKSNAIFWLGQIDDDRAMEMLEEIIDGGGR